jgi:adenine phosphoribosyltransferase
MLPEWLDAAYATRDKPGVLDSITALTQHRAVAHTLDTSRIESLIRAVPDFPAPGVLFRDITPLLYDPDALHEVMEALSDAVRDMGATLITGVESRGFIFGVPVAERLKLPFVPVRKPGKLPAEFASVAYELEYGSGTLEMHRTPPVEGHRVAIVDDLLATGGTAAAAASLVETVGGEVAGFAFVIELDDLRGRSLLAGHSITSLLHY